MIKFDEDICSDFAAASSREWIETNGIGGYASSTIASANTRRYHGLLTAAVNPPLGRLVLLSKFEEVLTVDGETFELSANQYPGALHPQGFRYLKSFRLDPFPVWTFEVEGLEIERSVFMVYGENTTVCQWEARPLEKRVKGNGKEVSLELKPLLAFRDTISCGTRIRSSTVNMKSAESGF